jgi:hypothetical protein
LTLKCCSFDTMATCFAMHGKATQTGVLKCPVYVARLQGKTACESCHRKQPRGSCECEVCCLNRSGCGGGNNARREESGTGRAKWQLPSVNYEDETHQDQFFVGKGKVDSARKKDSRSRLKWTEVNESKRQKRTGQQSQLKNNTDERDPSERSSRVRQSGE